MTTGWNAYEDYEKECEKVREISGDLMPPEAQYWDAERLPTSILPGNSKLITGAGEVVQNNVDSGKTASSQCWGVYLSLAHLKEALLLSRVIAEG
jgi:hypothetical protein